MKARYGRAHAGGAAVAFVGVVILVFGDLRSTEDRETGGVGNRTLGDFLRFNITPQDHINYALTWFTLSLCTALMAYARLRSSQTGRNWWYFTKRRKGLPS